MCSRLLAKDNDFTTEFNTVRYWLDTSVEHFYIDSISGELYLNKELDYEEQTQHHFTVCIKNISEYDQMYIDCGPLYPEKGCVGPLMCAVVISPS